MARQDLQGEVRFASKGPFPWSIANSLSGPSDQKARVAELRTIGSGPPPSPAAARPLLELP